MTGATQSEINASEIDLAAHADRPAVVVTGASSGIGWATVHELTSHGYRVAATVRREEGAERLRQEFGDRVYPLLLDVTEDEQIEAVAAQIASWAGDAGLAGLVNNAGIAVAAPLMHVDLDDLRYQFDVNVVGVVAVTQALLPLLGAQRDAPHPPGRIINIGSVSGHITYPFLAPYAASKHALESISDGMRREFSLYGIKVIVMVLGAVQTPIWEKAENQDIERYRATDYGAAVEQMHKTVMETARTAMPAAQAARAVRLALQSPKPRSRYVVANNRLLGWLVPRLMPEWLLDWALRKQLESSVDDKEG